MRPSELLAVLLRFGFEPVRQKGSHLIVRDGTGRWAPVPIHAGRDIDRFLIRAILRQLGISEADFLGKLRD